MRLLQGQHFRHDLLLHALPRAGGHTFPSQSPLWPRLWNTRRARVFFLRQQYPLAVRVGEQVARLSTAYERSHPGAPVESAKRGWTPGRGEQTCALGHEASERKKAGTPGAQMPSGR